MDWRRQVAPQPHWKSFPIFLKKTDNLFYVRWNTTKCHLSIPNPYNESIIPLLSHWQSTWSQDIWWPQTDSRESRHKMTVQLRCLRDISLKLSLGVFSLMLLKDTVWRTVAELNRNYIWRRKGKSVLLQCHYIKNIIRKSQVCGCGLCACACFPWQVAFTHTGAQAHTHTHTHTQSSAWDDSHAVTSG